MILNPQKYIDEARPFWTELENRLDHLVKSPEASLAIDEINRLHFLYRKALYDLVQLRTNSLDNQSVGYLESLVALAYTEIYSTRNRLRFSWRKIVGWFGIFASTFRQYLKYFIASSLLMTIGAITGASLLIIDPSYKEVVLPFPHLLGDPSDRVAEEESIEAGEDPMEGAKARFSSQLMQNNIRVSFFCFALGMTFGIGTSILLFYNGLILGMVACDYLLAGEGEFLFAWLLPHGSIEIPAILIAGQAGLILGMHLLPGLSPLPFSVRLRRITHPLLHLLLGIILMLIWAGFVESYLSQYHAPLISYTTKIIFGATSLFLFTLYLGIAGRKSPLTKIQDAT